MEYVSELTTRTATGGRTFRQQVAARPVAFRDGAGTLQAVNAAFIDSGIAERPHIVTDAPFMCSVGDTGARRLHPTREADVWVEIGRPYRADNQQPFPLNALVRDGNRLVSTNANAILTLTHLGHGIKFDMELLSGFVPPLSRVAFPVTLSGLTYAGGVVSKNGVPVMWLRRPYVYDAANPIDLRPVATTLTQMSGTSYIVLVLPSLAGMTRPVVDPTFDSQPDGTAGKDTFIQSDDATTNNGTDGRLHIGNFGASARRGLLQFDLSTIPSSATINSATLSLYLDFGGGAFSDGSKTIGVYRLAARDWVEAQATWNIYKTANNWGTSGCDNTSSDREAADIGTQSIPNTGATGDEYQIALTASKVQEWVSGAMANNGMLVKQDVEAGSSLYLFGSSDNGTSARRPRLVIDYTEAGVPGGHYFNRFIAQGAA